MPTNDLSTGPDEPWGGALQQSPTGYVVAFVALVAAVALRYLLDPWFGDTLPLVTTYGAVAAAVWAAGAGAAVVVSIAGYFAFAYLFVEPRGGFGLSYLGSPLALLAYFFTCSLIVAFGEATRRAQRRASERRDLLRVTLRSIGDAVI